jgi:hypothetical protein
MEVITELFVGDSPRLFRMNENIPEVADKPYLFDTVYELRNGKVYDFIREHPNHMIALRKLIPNIDVLAASGEIKNCENITFLDQSGTVSVNISYGEGSMWEAVSSVRTYHVDNEEIAKRLEKIFIYEYGNEEYFFEIGVKVEDKSMEEMKTILKKFVEGDYDEEN